MEPVRKRFEFDPVFPFSFVFKDTKTTQSELPDHLHDWYELVYVYRGRGTFFIDQAFYEMRKGDLFLIPGNTIHRAFPDKDDPVTSTAVFFSPSLVQCAFLGDSFFYLQSFEQVRRSRHYKCETPLTERPTVESHLEQIYEELRLLRLGYRQAILLKLQQTLLFLARAFAPNEHPLMFASAVRPFWMKEILVYIDENLSSKNLGLSELSQKASVTSGHFCRVFKQLTGMNVTEYLNMKRIVRAKELLLSMNHNVSTVASNCGFESLPHFYRLFKQIVGMTPAAYRNANNM
jgi:AraC-like DNA-binding protein